MIVPKKNGKLQVYVDYQKLNAVTKVDFFPLPFTESILEAVVGHKMYTLIDGYSGYNQIMIFLEDHLKTLFITKYGAFAYRVMPFGLICAVATFQRGMMKMNPSMTPGICGAVGERAQVILVWVKAPGIENASHSQRLRVTRVRP